MFSCSRAAPAALDRQHQLADTFYIQMMTIDDILSILPHRYPFLLLDGVSHLEPGRSAIGHKNVSANEWYFQGHFPEYAVMPGVLIVEALAQLGAVALLSLDEHKGKLAMFAGIDDFRFRREVRPGDTLLLRVEIDKLRGSIGKGTATASVNDEIAASGRLLFAIKESETVDS